VLLFEQDQNRKRGESAMSVAIAEKNIHVSLPEEIYRELRAEAARLQQPAKALARQAIEAWLAERRAESLDAEIAAYAARHAGSELDLDKELEAAGIEFLLATEKKTKRSNNKKKGAAK
jgi:hypothetical protein